MVLAQLSKRLAWPADELQLISANKIWIGATETQVICAWGYPRNTTSHTSSAGTVKHWFYGRVLSDHCLVSFSGGKCDGWSDSN